MELENESESPPPKPVSRLVYPNPPVSEIEPGLFLGDRRMAGMTTEPLEEKNITAMVSMTAMKPHFWSRVSYRAYLPQDRHLYIACLDSSTEDLLTRLPDICNFIEENRAPNTGVLVHCDIGVSRSATAVIGYLMRKYKQSSESALACVKKSRKVKPNANFMEQLAVWGEVGYELWEDAEKSIPKPPYAAWIEKRAAALKAKGLTGNEPTYPLDIDDL